MNNTLAVDFEVNDVILEDMYEKLEAEEFRLGWGTIDEVLAEYLSDTGMLSTDYLICRFDMSKVEACRLMTFLDDNFKQYRQ